MNFLDPDETYDILFAQRIKPEILELLKAALGSHGCIDNPFPLVMLERGIPNPVSPCADNWGEQFLEFAKKLSLTHILDDGFLNGSAYGFDPPYKANLPEQITLTLPPSTVTVTVPQGVGVVTWLERAHDVQSGPYCSAVLTPISVYMRRSRTFVNAGTEPLKFTLNTTDWLHNSVCLAGASLELTEDESRFLLYDRMTDFLNYLWGQLGIPECKVLTGLWAKLTSVFSVSQGRRDYPVIYYGFPEPSLYSQRIEYSQPSFSPVPDYSHYAALIKGEETTGRKITTVWEGGKFRFEIAYPKTFYDAWEEDEGAPPFPLQFEWAPAYNPTPSPVCYVSEESEPLTFPTNYSAIPGGAMFTGEIVGADFNAASATTTLLTMSIVGGFEVTGMGHFWEIAQTGTIPGSNYNATGIEAQYELRYQIDATFSAQKNYWEEPFQRGVCVHLFPSDPVLFREGESAILINDLQEVRESSAYLVGIPSYGYSPNWYVKTSPDTPKSSPYPVGTFTMRHFKTKNIAKVRLAYGDNLALEPTRIFTPYSAIHELASETAGDTDYAYSLPPSPLVFEEIENSVFLTRYLR